MQNAGLPGNGKKMLVGSKKDLFFFKKNFYHLLVHLICYFFTDRAFFVI